MNKKMNTFLIFPCDALSCLLTARNGSGDTHLMSVWVLAPARWHDGWGPPRCSAGQYRLAKLVYRSTLQLTRSALGPPRILCQMVSISFQNVTSIANVSDISAKPTALCLLFHSMSNKTNSPF